MNRGKKRRANRARGALQGAKDSLSSVRAGVGKVLVREADDVAIPTDATLDLVAESARVGGGTPAFKTRQADPMRAFTSKPVDAAYVRGGEAAFMSASGDANHVTAFDKAFPPGDKAREAGKRVVEVLGALPPEKRQRVLDGVMKNIDGIKQDEVEELTRLFDEMLPDEDTDRRQKRMEAVGLLTPEQRARLKIAVQQKSATLCASIIAERRQEFQAHERETVNNSERIRLKKAAYEDLVEMGKAPRLQKLGETGFHKCVEAWKSGKIITALSNHEIPTHLWTTMTYHRNVFVVQHDWAAAFQGATDFAEGEFRLPYEECVFEFRISGRRVCMSVLTNDYVPASALLNIETPVGWAIGASYSIQNGEWLIKSGTAKCIESVRDLCRSQMRAICIALEAEVAITDVVRAPHKLNRIRERKGKIPIYDHRIVSLAHRRRYAPRLAEPGDIEEEKHHKRLHFVRGHWRHYTNTKSWIKWHLRGNPDLGFVDKEYRL